jgi:hypothetical protein
LLIEELGLEPGRPLQELQQSILRHDEALDVASNRSPARRAILVAVLDPIRLDGMLAISEPLARFPPRELIIVECLPVGADIATSTTRLLERRERLLAEGITARTAAFSTATAARDILRLVAEQDVDLLVINGSAVMLDDPVVEALLTAVPCDVAVYVGGLPQPGGVLVPFAGADHDWAAVELAAWIAGAEHRKLRLVGPTADPAGSKADSSRLLASASIAIQQANGIAAEPLLVEADADAVVRAAAGMGVIVIGLPDRWRSEGAGPIREALATRTTAASVLVRRGIRPGGLAPPEGLTRYTWSLGASSA